jgi:hypothetical protein
MVKRLSLTGSGIRLSLPDVDVDAATYAQLVMNDQGYGVPIFTRQVVNIPNYGSGNATTISYGRTFNTQPISALLWCPNGDPDADYVAGLYTTIDMKLMMFGSSQKENYRFYTDNGGKDHWVVVERSTTQVKLYCDKESGAGGNQNMGGAILLIVFDAEDTV